MATINFFTSKLIRPAPLVGLVILAAFLLAGCQTGKSPEGVTEDFWQSLAQGQLEQAGKQATTNSRDLVKLPDIDKLSSVEVGDSDVEDDVAMVSTTISRNRRLVNFDTVLLREKDAWKVDYLQTQMNIAMLPLGEVINTLKSLGGAFSKQLERQLPQIQKEIESLGNGLKYQIEGLGRSLGEPGNPRRPGAI